jgi:phage terminase large subunit-like protein
VSDGIAALLARLAALNPRERDRVFARLTNAQKLALHEHWWGWAHDSQKEPKGDWRVWLIRAGRGFGKTRAGAEWVQAYVRANPEARVALVGGTMGDVVKVMVEGPAGLIACAHHGERLRWLRDRGELHLGEKAVAHVYSAEAPEALRGPEHDIAWCDELAKWGCGGERAWDNLMLGLRRGAAPRVLVTTTPRRVALMDKVTAAPGLHETLGRTRENPHLPESFVTAMLAEHGGTRWGRQELDGEMLEDVERALWSRDLLERQRVAAAPALVRVVVGVDPPAGVDGDACGIVAVGLARDGQGYVLEDASVGGASPQGWAHAVAACAARHRAERVVAEANQGGAMVESVLRAADAALPVKLVHASRGKAARAEPVSLLYEKGTAWHAGAWPQLEDEMCGLQLGGGYEGPGRSPDRADALVWAMHALMLAPRGGEAAVRPLWDTAPRRRGLPWYPAN